MVLIGWPVADSTLSPLSPSRQRSKSVHSPTVNHVLGFAGSTRFGGTGIFSETKIGFRRAQPSSAPRLRPASSRPSAPFATRRRPAQFTAAQRPAGPAPELRRTGTTVYLLVNTLASLGSLYLLSPSCGDKDTTDRDCIRLKSHDHRYLFL